MKRMIFRALLLLGLVVAALIKAALEVIGSLDSTLLTLLGVGISFGLLMVYLTNKPSNERGNDGKQSKKTIEARTC